MKIVVDETKCNGCGACAMACPHQNIKIVDGKVKPGKLKCKECGACVEVCPSGAITIE